MHTQEVTRHVLMLCGTRVLQGRAPHGNMARQLFDAFPKIEICLKETLWQIECFVAKNADNMEGHRASASRSHQKARNECEPGLVASLIRVAR